MKIVKMHPISYRGRKINWRQDAWVYRNLMRTDGPWYSILQNQVVVAHSRVVMLHDVRFVVREGGRQRVIASGVKNVHAFAVGKVSLDTELYFKDDQLVQLRHRAGYLPKFGFWVDYKTDFIDAYQSPEAVRFKMSAAGGALLSQDGLTVDEPTTVGELIK